MAPVNIPEGSVFVARRAGKNVAKQLLDAAEEVGADLVASVRTTTGGYHVFAEVAERYQENLGEPVADSTEDENEDADSTEDDSTEGDAGKTGDDQEEETEEELEPLPVTAENTKAEITKYADELDPKVDVSKAANKAEMIEILETARAPKTAPDAE